MKAEIQTERTRTGISVAVSGDQIEPFTITTQIVAPPDIGKYVTDRILSIVYLRRYTIIINGAVAFESFDAEINYEAFIKMIEAARESGP